jgi:hypothetical protein
MNWQAATAFALHLALLAPAALVLLRGRGAGEAISLSRVGYLAAGYTVVFIVLALYWQVPIDVRHSVYAESQKIISATPDRLKCDQVMGAIEEMSAGTNGAIALNSRGQMRVPTQIWESLSVERQEALSILATRGQECAAAAEAGSSD